jgi:hypothetical protein
MDKPLGAIRGIALGIALLGVTLYAAWGMSLGGRSDSFADCLRSIQQHESLIQDKAVLFRSIKVSQDITDRLVDGHLSLTDAVAALRDEIENRPTYLQPPLYIQDRNIPPEERYMRQLLIRITNQLQDDPRQEEVLTRLRAELRAYRAARTRPVANDAPKSRAVAASRGVLAP